MNPTLEVGIMSPATFSSPQLLSADSVSHGSDNDGLTADGAHAGLSGDPISFLFVLNTVFKDLLLLWVRMCV